MLAASFQNGLAIFHVGLPVAADKATAGFVPLPDPTPQTTVGQTPVLLPVTVKRWAGDHDQAFATWLNAGPYDGPCIGVLLHETERNGGAAVVALGAVRLPLYRRGPTTKGKPIPFDVVSYTSYQLKSEPYPMCLLHVPGGDSIKLYSEKLLFSVALRRMPMMNDPAVIAMRYPVSTIPPGLSSTGEPLLTDANDDKEGILHVYSVMQCERQKSSINSGMQDWSRPRRRYWLCRTLIGDTKVSALAEESKEGAGGFGNDEAVRGGASSDSVCELFDEAVDKLLPFRLVRCKGANLCAVIYRSALSTKVGSASALSMDGLAIAFVDYSGANPAIRVVEGRDVAFAPMEGGSSPRGWILSRDGSMLTFFTWDTAAKSCNLGSAFRPVVGVDTDVNYIESRRIFVCSGASMIVFAVVGTRLRDNRACLISGDLCSISEVTADRWSALLPNIVTGRSLWLREHEEVNAMIGLENDDSGYRNFALSTSQRVIVVSSGMAISAEAPTAVPANVLAPLGSFAVAFIADNKLRYLCCLDGRYAQGIIATLPVPQHGHAPTMLTAVRPDRFLVARIHESIRLVEYGQNPHIFLLPTSKTRPALMLEPMVANAICVGGKQSLSTNILRTVIEKFGRKIASLTHGEDEGIGNLGAGLTAQTFEILNTYGLHQAASWLLTGSVPFDRSANSRILPPWVPIAPKAKASLNSDAFMHVVSSGDPYLSEYIKSPGQNMPSTLPRQSDSMAYISREMGKDSLRQGKALDALKMFDLVGSTTSDALILQIALVMKKEASADVMSILKSLSGYDNTGSFNRSTSAAKAPASLAALAVSLRQGGPMPEAQADRFMKSLAPSLQRGARVRRTRLSLFTEDDLASAGEKIQNPSDPVWVTPCNESKHVW